ncbi:hypothetical protein D3C75_685540 [compost metagenome]
MGLQPLVRAYVVDELIYDAVGLVDVRIDALLEVLIPGGHHLGRQPDAGQGRTQIVGYPGHHQVALFDQALDGVRHVVEGAGQAAHLPRAVLSQSIGELAPRHGHGPRLQIFQRSHQLAGKAPCRKQGHHQQHAHVDDEGLDVVILDLGQGDAHPHLAGLGRLDPDDVVVLDLDPDLGFPLQLAADVLLQIGVGLGILESVLLRLALGVDVAARGHIDQRLGILAQRQLVAVGREDELDLIGQQVADLLDGGRQQIVVEGGVGDNLIDHQHGGQEPEHAGEHAAHFFHSPSPSGTKT